MMFNRRAKPTLLGLIITALFTLLPLHTVLARPTAGPATIHDPVVNTLTDLESDGCGAGDCTLREAIAAAEPGSEITFSVTGVVSLSQGQLVIDKDLTITGPEGEGIRISGSGSSRVMLVMAGNVVLNRVTIQDGYSGEAGAGIDIETGAAVTMNQCAVMNNVISNNQPGGGIRVAPGGTLTLNNCTVTRNQSGGDASGILGEIDSTVTINYSTITDNYNTTGYPSAGGGGILGGVNLRGSIVAGNLGDAYWGPDCYTPESWNLHIQSYGYNYIQNPGGTCWVDSVENPGTDKIGAQNQSLPDAGLGALYEKASFAPYYPLMPGSPALNAIPADKCSATVDQRGYPRPQFDQCDLGAVEMGPAPTAEDGSFTTQEGKAYTGSVSATSPEGAPLTYAAFREPNHGVIDLNGKDFTYTPVDRYSGPDSFVISVADEEGNAALATFTVTVTPAPLTPNPDGHYVFSTFNSTDPRYQWVDLADCQQSGGECKEFDLTQPPVTNDLPGYSIQFPFHFFNGFHASVTINTQGYFSLDYGAQIRVLAGNKTILPGTTHIYLLQPVNPLTRQMDSAIIAYVDLADALDPTLLSTAEAILGADGSIRVLYQKVNGALDPHQGLGDTPQYMGGKDDVYFPSSRIHSGMGVDYQPNFYLTTPGKPLTVSSEAGLLANDYTAAGSPVTIAYDPKTNTPPAYGALEVNSDGSFTYTPIQGYTGPDQFTYTASGAGAEQTAWVFLQVNSPPVVDTTQTFTVNEGEWLSGSAQVTDEDNDQLSYYLKTYPQHGSLSFGPYGPNIYYQPEQYYNGPDQYTVVVMDAVGYQVAFPVNITVTPVDNAPLAVPDGYYTVTDSNDPQGPKYQWDEIQITGAELSYDDFATPDADWDPLDDSWYKDPLTIGFNFPFMAQNFQQLWVNSNGYITFGGSTGVTDIPGEDPRGGDIGNAILLLGGDRYIAEGYTHIYYQKLSNPDRFVVEFLALDGCCTSGKRETAEMILYPDGRIIIQYKYIEAEDDQLSAVGIKDDGSYWLPYPAAALKSELSVAYQPAPLPVESGASHTFTFDELMANDQEFDGDTVALTSAQALEDTHGALTVDKKARTVTYQPAQGYKGFDTFSYTIQDQATGQQYTSTANVWVVVNDRPAAGAVDPLVVDEGASVSGKLPGSDAEKDPFHFVIKTNPAHGALKVNDDGTFTYTANQGYTGADSFTFAAVDNWGRESTPVTVSITVKAVVKPVTKIYIYIPAVLH